MEVGMKIEIALTIFPVNWELGPYSGVTAVPLSHPMSNVSSIEYPTVQVA
jgi:hypothetical protein